MKIFIAYADKKYQKTRNFAGKMAKWFGKFDKVVLYSPDDIDDDFKNRHKETFAIKRGAGLWLWKPYIIAKTLIRDCNEGDYLFYADSGSFFIRSVDHIIKAMGKDDIYVTTVPLVEWQFTKADCFQLLDCNNEKVKNSAQIQGTFVCIRKTQHSIEFIYKWLKLCSDIKLLHPENIALGLTNPKGYIAHREDQSLLSLLSKKEGVVPHEDPSQFGKYPEKYWYRNYIKVVNNKKEEYPTIIILHRMPFIRWKVIFKNIFLLLIPHKIGALYINYKHNLK